MQDLEQAKKGLILQKKLQERFDLLQNIAKCVPSEIIAEIDSWTEPLTAHQPEPFASNMRGKIMSGINYISKLLSDFLLDGDLFLKTYEPHPLRPFLNYLLQKHLEVTDHISFLPYGKKERSLREEREEREKREERENERQFLIKVLTLANAVLKKKTIMKLYTFEDKNNFGLYALANHMQNEKDVYISKAIEILKNPLASPYCSLTSSLSPQPLSPLAKEEAKERKKAKEKYVAHLVPDAQLSSTFLSGLKTIYFSV